MNLDLIVWLPGTGLALHHAWLAWRGRGAKQSVTAWTCAMDVSPVPQLSPEQVVQLLAELKMRAIEAGELPNA